MCLAAARFRLVAIEAILPLGTVCRGVGAFLFWKLIDFNDFDGCVPRVLFKVSNIAPYSLPIADYFLFRTHYVVMYSAIFLSMALIAYERKTDKIIDIGLCKE